MSKNTANNAPAPGRLLWQGRRGALELDIILSNYIKHHYPQLSARLQQDFQLLLQQDDPKLMDWLVYRNPPVEQLRQIVADVLAKTAE